VSGQEAKPERGCPHGNQEPGACDFRQLQNGEDRGFVQVGATEAPSRQPGVHLVIKKSSHRPGLGRIRPSG